jgi:DNA-directed RNA polymerase specialized sigma24 family protein
MEGMPDPSPEVVERLVAEHRRFLAFLIPRTASPAEAEDLLQEAYVRSLERGAQLRDDEKLVATCGTCTEHGCLDCRCGQPKSGGSCKTLHSHPSSS